MKYLRVFLIISVLLCPTLLWADIYRSVDKDGVIHFTNSRSDGSCELYLREGPKEVPPQEAAADPRPPVPDNWVMEYADQFSRANRLSPALVKAIIKAESNFSRWAVSRKGAVGMMQLMPFTSKRLKVSDPYDPVENIEGGVKYIKELLTTFRGNLVYAVAAYNAGPGAVRKYGGVPPYQETRLYVKKVMDYYRQYQTAE